MARRTREHDWSATPLGPIPNWPRCLQAAVDLILINGFPMAVLWGPDLILIYNDAHRDLMGDRHPSGLGQPIQVAVPELWPVATPVHEQVWAGETVTLEDACYPVMRSGTLKDAWVTLSCSPLRDDAGTIAGILVTVFETTERVLAEASLLESAERFRTVVQNLPDYAIFMLDPDGIVVGWWEGAQRITGYAAAEMMGRHFSYFYVPEEVAAQVPRRELAEAAQTGRSENEGWRIRKDGERFWVNEIVTAVRDETGDLRGFTKISCDLTQRMRAEAAVRASEERLRHIVEQATDYAIFTTDPTGLIESWSAGAEAVFCWTAEEAVGQSFAMTFTPRDQAEHVPEQELHEAREHGSIPNVRWHLRQDGRPVFIYGVARAHCADDGTFLGLLKIGQDVTESILAEDRRREGELIQREQLEAEVTKATLDLRAVSRRLLLVQEEERRRLALELHDEIGQVLTGLNFQLAAVTGVGGDASLGEAQATVQILTEQVRQLSMDLRPQVLDRYGVLAAVEWYVERYQHRTGITIYLRHEGLERRFAPEVEIAAFRVVQEALTNIARYAEVDEAWVTLFGDGSLLVVIHDRGRGFDPALGFDSSGLAGMRERVELLGGTFDLETAPGEGVHLAAEFPLDDGAAPANAES